MGLFDFVDSIFDPVSGGGFFGDVISEVGLPILGGLVGGQPQQVSYPTYQPTYALPAPMAQPVMASAGSVAARAVAAGLPAWSARFPSLWQAIQRLRAQGSKLSVQSLLSALRRWGPQTLTTMIGAAAVADLISYSMTRKRRRMNPANARALRRSMRRMRAFENLSHRVSAQLSSACRPRRRRSKC